MEFLGTYPSRQSARLASSIGNFVRERKGNLILCNLGLTAFSGSEGIGDEARALSRNPEGVRYLGKVR